ncbi:MAG: M1 family metallopeptidase [Bacteroidota bacterium]
MRKYFLTCFFFVFLFFPLFGKENKLLYFQQEVNYKINVSLNDKEHELIADETLEYINNSPNELTFIWFHLWPNGYSNNNTALGKQLLEERDTVFYFANTKNRGYIDGLDFKVNGKSVQMKYHPDYIDICKIILNEPLKPGEKIIITTPFHVKIPLGVFSRLGHIDQQYQITQWYPKPAVYDKYGWHPIPYLNQGEFYSEFGTYDVFITLPKNYVVGATGDLIDGETETEWLNQKAEEAKEMMTFQYDVIFPPSSSETKTLHYHQEKIHDFAWFADKRYYVMKSEVELPYTKRKVTTWVMFTGSEGHLWKKAVQYVNDAVFYFSKWNGEYPYNHCTAVDGALSAGGGMEYPNITVIGNMNDDSSLERVIIHEVCHNWFYGILGSNERDHAWMDEGITSFNENRYMEIKYPSNKTKTTLQTKPNRMNINISKIFGMDNLNEKFIYDLCYRFNAAKKMDQPIDFPSSEYTFMNYGIIVYAKTATIFEYLQAYLGEENFDKCMQTYFEKWKFMHPYPDDIKNVFEEVFGKNLNWFFDSIIKTTKQIDYKISSARNKLESKVCEVTLKNKGGISSPFSISAMNDGKILSTQWYEGFAGKKTVTFSLPDTLSNQIVKFDHLKIDAQNKMPDINRQNNTLKIKGLFRQVEPFNLKIFGWIHNPEKTQLFFTPVIGWNNYNKFMLGAAVYNNLLPEKKFEWIIMPMYGFENKDLAGGASVHYNIHPDKFFQTIRFGVNAERYCYSNKLLENLNFNKVSPELFFEFKKKSARSSIKQRILARQVNITLETAINIYDSRPPIYNYDSSFIAINDFTYSLTNTQKINPYNIYLKVQQGEGFVKSSFTVNSEITFRGKRKSLNIRLFAGNFFNRPNNFDGIYFFKTSGARGVDDYLYNYVYPGRSAIYPYTTTNIYYRSTVTEQLLSHQFVESDGGMKIYCPIGNSSSWMTALNIKCSLPRKIPFRLFADAIVFPDKSVLGQNILLDAGIYFSLVKNIVDIYIPLVWSEDIQKMINNRPDKKWLDKFVDNIRFTFNIHLLNPFNLVRDFSF